VTLRGVSRSRCILAMDGADVTFVAGVEGASVEDLTIDGAGDGLHFRRGGRFCTLRRLVVVRARARGLHFDADGYQHLAIDDVRIDQCGGDGFALLADAPCESVFVTGLAVGTFGTSGVGLAAGVRLSGRCHLSQIQVGPVSEDQIGLSFLEGSDDTTLSNYHVTTDGGRGFEGQERTVMGVGVVQEVVD